MEIYISNLVKEEAMFNIKIKKPAEFFLPSLLMQKRKTKIKGVLFLAGGSTPPTGSIFIIKGFAIRFIFMCESVVCNLLQVFQF